MKLEALELLNKFEYLGKEVLKNGTTLIGRAPQIAPKAWLHRIYTPLNWENIDELETECQCPISLSYRKFLMETNGLAVFNTTFSLYGKRNNYIRNEENVWQPFDIVTPNTLERPENADKNVLIIGSYNYDGSKLYIDSLTNKVHLCERYDSTSLYQWDSFDEMIYSEIKRLITLFDSEGKKLIKGQSTLPIC